LGRNLPHWGNENLYSCSACFLVFLFLFAYLNNQVFPQPLSEVEEKRYLKELREGSEDARNVLVERNLRLVAHVVRKYESTGEDMEDLISIGTIGLIKGIKTFDNEKGVKLATYVARCVENEVLMSGYA
jgi:RNA polymerase sporulation-specific sigma factor